MRRYEKEMVCRHCGVDEGGSRGGAPFVLPGAKPYYVPSRACDVEHISIAVTLDFAARKVHGVCTQIVHVLSRGPAVLELDAVEMEIAEVTLQNAPIAFSYDGKKLRVDLGTRSYKEQLTLRVKYSAQPRRGLYFIAPDAAYPNKPVEVWSQGQDEDNRHWFPCFDHPNEKATSEVLATVPEDMTALSNGKLLAETHDAAAHTKTFHYRLDVPHASYLITLVAGHFKIQHEKVGELDLYYYLPPERVADSSRTFGNTADMIRLFEKKTGQPYPYGRYSQIVVSDFIFGGMENTSATTLTEQTLHDARAHIDFSSEQLISHELAHQWFGDLVTCRDWSHGWLNEGFATYLEIIWREHSASLDEADYDRLADMDAYIEEAKSRYQRAIVSNVFHEPIDVFDRHLYEKGGCVLHMLRHALGDERFWHAIGFYLTKHRGGSVETRDLARAIDDATGENVDAFFAQWLFRAGHPVLDVAYEWLAGEKLAKVTVEQKQARPAGDNDPGVPLFQFFVQLRCVVDGKTIDKRLALAEARETFFIALAEAPTQFIFDSGAATLMVAEIKKPIELWRNELAAAARGIDRVLAARALRNLMEPLALDALVTALQHDTFWAVRGEAALALGALRNDAAKLALLAALVTEKHAKARRLIARALGAFTHDSQVASVIKQALARGDESYFVEAELALSLGKTRDAQAFVTLQELMKRPAYLDAIASACLQGMAELRDEAVVPIARGAAKYGAPAIARRAAILAMGALGAEFSQHRHALREDLEELLDDPDFRARIAAVEGLRILGDLAGSAALGVVANRDLDGRVRRRAREAIAKLAERNHHDGAVSLLREGVERLDRENRELRSRLDQMSTGPRPVDERS